MCAPKYRVYPSLLDKFQRYLDADKEFEAPWNVGPDDEYKRSLEEIAAELEQSLLDSVNRAPHEASEAADKGTAFNAFVDFLIAGRELPEGMEYELGLAEDGAAVYRLKFGAYEGYIEAGVLSEAALYFEGCLPQYQCRAMIDTAAGPVELYGYIDEIRADRVYDIKTTKMYTAGDPFKFEHGWQRYVYPFCLMESGDASGITAFEYTVFQWVERVGKPSGANMFREVYTYNHEDARVRLRGILEQFAAWLEAHRDKITDTKIFGL